MGELQALQVNYRMFVDVRNENTGKIVAKQNDTKTRYLDITITDNGVPVDLTGCEVRIYGRKYDKTEFYNDGSLQDAAAGRCLFEATTQMLAYPGQNVNCEIVVFRDNVQILSTMPFDIFVVESLMGAGAIESSNEYGALVVLFQNLCEAYDLMTRMVETIGFPDEVAAQYDLVTMWQCWEFLVAYMKGDLTTMIAEALANASVQGVLDMLNDTTAKEDTSQEILENITVVPNVKIKSGCGTGAQSLTTVLDVVGKGKLCFALQAGYANNSNGQRIRITVDGVVIADLNALHGNANNAQTIVGLINPSYFLGYISGSGTTQVIMPKTVTAANTNTADTLFSLVSLSSIQTIQYTDFSPDMQTVQANTSSNNGSIQHFIFIDAPIIFNESLKIEVANNVAQRYQYSIGYKLDE